MQMRHVLLEAERGFLPMVARIVHLLRANEHHDNVLRSFAMSRANLNQSCCLLRSLQMSVLGSGLLH